MGGLGSCSHSSKQLKGMRSSMLVALAFMGVVSAQCLGAVTDRATTTGSAAGKQKKRILGEMRVRKKQSGVHNACNFTALLDKQGGFEIKERARAGGAIAWLNDSYPDLVRHGVARLGQILVGTDHGPTADEWVADMAAVCAEIGVEYVVSREGCALPPVSVSQFLHSFAQRTLVFWGDSIMRNWCEDIQWWLQSRRIIQGAPNIFDDMRAFQRIMTLLCDQYENGVVICCLNGFMNHLTDYLFKVEDQLLVTLQKRLTQDDIVIVNAGLHFVDRPSKRLLGHSVQRFVDSYWALSGKAPMLWWRETSPQHFPGTGGYDRVAFQTAGKRGCGNSSTNEFNEITTPIIEQAKLPIIRIFDGTSRFHKVHYGKVGDCTHYCRGISGPYKYWTMVLQGMGQTLAPPKGHPIAARVKALFECPDAGIVHEIPCIEPKHIKEVKQKKTRLMGASSCFVRGLKTCCEVTGALQPACSYLLT